MYVCMNRKDLVVGIYIRNYKNMHFYVLIILAQNYPPITQNYPKFLGNNKKSVKLIHVGKFKSSDLIGPFPPFRPRIIFYHQPANLFEV